jgi:hypothetical protein
VAAEPARGSPPRRLTATPAAPQLRWLVTLGAAVAALARHPGAPPWLHWLVTPGAAVAAMDRGLMIGPGLRRGDDHFADFFFQDVFFFVDFFFAVLFVAVLFVVDFFAVDFFFVDFLDAAFFFGTLAPALRASDSPIAIACLRLFTFLPEPLLSVPFLRSCMTFFTFSPAFLPYAAMKPPRGCANGC